MFYNILPTLIASEALDNTDVMVLSFRLHNEVLDLVCSMVLVFQEADPGEPRVVVDKGDIVP